MIRNCANKKDFNSFINDINEDTNIENVAIYAIIKVKAQLSSPLRVELYR